MKTLRVTENGGSFLIETANENCLLDTYNPEDVMYADLCSKIVEMKRQRKEKDAVLAPARDARDRIVNCPGYIRRECLTCDEAGACVVEMAEALAMFEEE